ncbi:MAG: MBL fold metallo-hydrolase [Oxalicibacterium faecigallinarum]|uniref:MBL fold metallo-hydrolase n=1 Tax=Oxalicibacterium faecigallinarum TaxID=573741 RepID=UPI002808EC65|nr:MBL fold metallo-hydrolase [Oxalicibacterium faecigallinarum]MDQ7969680.1 MBL fold metallo-hydrolase [Oxalicibacterium faecigallinarum]
MRSKFWLIKALVAVFFFGPIAQVIAAPAKDAKLTVLYDAFGKEGALEKDWGYAALIEVDGKRILFDTGNNGDILKKNAAAKNVDLSKLDFVVMSHRHGDHMGGLAYVLSLNPKVKIYAPKEGFGVYGGDLPSSFYPKDTSLPPEQRYFDGKPAETLHFGSAWPGADFKLIDKDAEIAPGIHVIAQVSDKKGTLELRELSLAINTPNGVIIVVGCSHSGVENIVAAATKINPKIQFVGGGFHLIQGQAEELSKVITALRDTYKVAYIAPGHCTGELTFTALKKAFGDHYLYAGLGSVFVLGEKVKNLSTAGTAALDWEDFHDLRHHLARSDDAEHIQLAAGIDPHDHHHDHHH